MTGTPNLTARRVRHKKRGTTYTVLGTAELQIATTDLVDGSFLTVYQGEDGKWWARQEHEFEDDRFEDVPLTDTTDQTATMPSSEELMLVAKLLESEARSPWHIHPDSSPAASNTAAWLRRLIAEEVS